MAFYSPLAIDKQILKGSQRSKSFAVFNDDFRDAIKGDANGYEKGYIQGIFSNKLGVETGIAGSIAFDKKRIGFADNASETINYFNCHDNLILFDKLAISLNEYKNIDDYVKLALGIIFLSFGKPFIYEGNEFNHSKNNDANSYRSPLKNNSIKWQDKIDNMEIFLYLKSLIELRKKLAVFKHTDHRFIKDNLSFMENIPDSVIIYQIKNKKDRYLFIINCAMDELSLERDKLDEFINFHYHKFTKIFSKEGINKTDVNVSDALIIEGKSVNVFKLGVENGL